MDGNLYLRVEFKESFSLACRTMRKKDTATASPLGEKAFPFLNSGSFKETPLVVDNEVTR